MKRFRWVILTGAFLVAIFCARVGFALDASSTNFFIRQEMGDIQGRSASSTFILFQSDSGEGLGISASSTFRVISGMIRNLFQSVAPDYTLSHYHWRNDDASEALATSATSGNEDTSLSNLSKTTGKRIRIGINNAGGTVKNYSAQQFRLEYGFLTTTCGSISSWTDVGASGGDWDMFGSANLTDGDNTTNIAESTGGVTDTNYAFLSTNGGVRDTTSTVSAVLLPSDSFIELEYSVQALESATSSGTYCFRVTNAGSASNFSYDIYPEVTISAGGSTTISLTLSTTTITLSGLVPGIAISATSSASVTITNGTNGYSLRISRDSATSTIASSSVTFPDYTAWNPGSGCSAGQGNGSASPGANLSFRVQQTGTDSSYCSFWWGDNDTGGTALFAGFPTSSQNIVSATSTNNGTTATTLLYRVDAPSTQNATNYSGTITITAITNL